MSKIRKHGDWKRMTPELELLAVQYEFCPVNIDNLLPNFDWEKYERTKIDHLHYVQRKKA